MTPTPRVQHCPPGTSFTLPHEHNPRTVSHIQGRHAVCTDGLIITLCHPVRPEGMLFGDGAGWRPA